MSKVRKIDVLLGGILAAGSVSALAGVGRAEVVVRETFDGPSGLSFSAYNGGALAPANGALRVSGPGGARFGSSTFSPVTLGVGDRMTFSFDISGEYEGSPNDVPGFRLGIFGSGLTPEGPDDAGYTFGMLSSPNFSGSLYDDGPTTLERGPSEVGTFMNEGVFIGQTQNFEFQLTRRTDELFKLTLVQNGSVVTTTDFAQPLTSTFDNIQFGFFDRMIPDAVYLDNITVTYTAVPEPAAMSLLGAAAAGLMCRRR